jgi:hypothetical protein
MPRASQPSQASQHRRAKKSRGLRRGFQGKLVRLLILAPGRYGSESVPALALKPAVLRFDLPGQERPEEEPDPSDPNADFTVRP